MKIFISFVEESIMNPKYQGYVGGRIEVHRPEDRGYHSEEIRFLTKNVVGLNRIRVLWDMRYVTKPQLDFIRDYVKLHFNER